ncbi:MAG: sigma-54-dependent Fis family transcriptional regulator, partial [gamma proteobacterium symbiont of Phacoides pectinatus]
GKDVIDCMQRYDWPGNIRELENVLMKSIALSQGDSLTRDLLPPPLCLEQHPASPDDHDVTEKPLQQCSLEEMERMHVARVLDAVAWHKGQACEILGISRPRLRRMINQHKLAPPNDIRPQDADGEQETSG